MVTCDFSNSSTSFHQPVLICLSREKVKVVLKADTKKKRSRNRIEKKKKPGNDCVGCWVMDIWSRNYWWGVGELRNGPGAKSPQHIPHWATDGEQH